MLGTRTKKIAVSLAGLFLLTLPGSGVAGPPGQWTQITDPAGHNIDLIGLTRTSDGILHVVWKREGSTATNDDLLHTEIDAGGVMGTTNVIAENWGSAGYPDVLTQNDGTLRTFWGGIPATDQGNNDDVSTATAPAAGEPWTVATSVVPSGASAYAGDIGAGIALDGTTFQSWGVTGGVYVHRGLSSGTPNFEYHRAMVDLCCGYLPDLGTDSADGTMYVAWFSNATDFEGVYAQQVNTSTGAPVGSPMRMPGSATEFNGQMSSSIQQTRTPLTGRPVGQPGVYVAYPGGYPQTTKVLVWKAGAATSTNIAGGQGPWDDVSIAAAPDGRLWVAWASETDPVKLYARRSNIAVTKWGERISKSLPAGTSSAWSTLASAQAARLDVLANVSTAGALSFWHTQLKPGLSLRSNKSSFTGKKTVTFTVTDAGDPIQGAKVSVGGKSKLTDGSGKASFELGPYKPAKTLTVTATKSGYTGDSLKVKGKPA